MEYQSTRGGDERRPFRDILLAGLAPNGGLYLPARYPHIDTATLSGWRSLSYPELAHRVLSLFMEDIPDADLASIMGATYTAQAFGSTAIAPLTALPGLGGDVRLLELSNGPTLAFKDMAMQLLGALFEYELHARSQVMNILGATSGDTGSAAEYAMRGRDGIAVFMLSPDGRMSPFQQAQMFTLDEANIHNLAVDGVFDDCQDLVKAVSADADLKRSLRIGTVNSINWARLAAQIVYYVWGYLRATGDAGTGRAQVDFAVPSGNFGNICAGHIARQMGLPIRRLVLATNENNVLEEFFRTGAYRVRGSADTHATSSPSMDISKASNVERFIFDLLDRDGDAVADLFGVQVPRNGGFDLGTAARDRAAEQFGFVAGMSTHADRLATIARVYSQAGRLIDTHTADGVKVALSHLVDDVPMVVLETAQPVKFGDVVRQATGVQPPMPAAVAELESLPRHKHAIPAQLPVLIEYLKAHALH
ncbi:MAG: threonine synthase [Beutenbergiaceae bacterium]